MLLTEYNEKKHMRMFRKEAREEGLKEGREEGLKEGRNHLIKTMLQNGASPEHLSEITGLPLSEINVISQNEETRFDLLQEARGKRKRR